jgi:hypothetical protein
MTLALVDTRKIVCQTNIIKYNKILTMQLNPDDRHYAELRLTEERVECRQLVGAVVGRPSRMDGSLWCDRFLHANSQHHAAMQQRQLLLPGREQR